MCYSWFGGLTKPSWLSAESGCKLRIMFICMYHMLCCSSRLTLNWNLAVQKSKSSSFQPGLVLELLLANSSSFFYKKTISDLFSGESLSIYSQVASTPTYISKTAWMIHKGNASAYLGNHKSAKVVYQTLWEGGGKEARMGTHGVSDMSEHNL